MLVTTQPWLSAIVVISERVADVATLHAEYRDGLDRIERPYELLYVVDGDHPEVTATLRRLTEQGERLRIVTLARAFGEATALTTGVGQAQGEVILTLPPYPQAAGEHIPALVAALDGNDMVVARRWPRREKPLKRLQSALFQGSVDFLLGSRFHDLGCGIRVIRRSVLGQFDVYGDQHRFLPLLAEAHGFRVREVDVPQDPRDRLGQAHPLGVCIRRLLDVVTVTFLLKFTHKPLRFFGLLGTGLASAGGLLSLFLGIERLLFGVPLADRPILVLAVLMIVLGIQLLAIGLIGEIVIFTRGRRLKPYRIDEIIG